MKFYNNNVVFTLKYVKLFYGDIDSTTRATTGSITVESWSGLKRVSETFGLGDVWSSRPKTV